MTIGVTDLPVGGQVVIYFFLAMLIFIFAIGLFSIFNPPMSDADNVEPFFNLDTLEQYESPQSQHGSLEEKRMMS